MSESNELPPHDAIDAADAAVKASGVILGIGDFNSISEQVARAILAERKRAAHVGYCVCAETRHVTLGDQVAAAICAPTPA